MRVPLQDTLTEFESLILAITKILIDSINENKIKEQLIDLPADLKGGINFFEAFLKLHEFTGITTHIQFSRKVQGLRSSGVAHRKGATYLDSVKYFKINDRSTIAIFKDILQNAIGLIEALDSHFL